MLCWAKKLQFAANDFQFCNLETKGIKKHGFLHGQSQGSFLQFLVFWLIEPNYLKIFPLIYCRLSVSDSTRLRWFKIGPRSRSPPGAILRDLLCSREIGFICCGEIKLVGPRAVVWVLYLILVITVIITVSCENEKFLLALVWHWWSLLFNLRIRIQSSECWSWECSCL